MKFCSNCGRLLSVKIPAGDDRSRYVCESCGMIHYQNPKMVVGCIPERGDRILLCRRSIEPRWGKWTIPAGYLENGETVTQGARRESLEEARARFDELTPYRLFNIRHVNQMYMIFRGVLADDDFSRARKAWMWGCSKRRRSLGTSLPSRSFLPLLNTISTTGGAGTLRFRWAISCPNAMGMRDTIQFGDLRHHWGYIYANSASRPIF